MANTPIVNLILKYPGDFLNRDMLIEIFTLPERHVAKIDQKNKQTVVELPVAPYVGKLVVLGSEFVRILTFNRVRDTDTYQITTEPTGVVYDEKEDAPLVVPKDECLITNQSIANYKGEDALATTIGRFLMNYFLFVYPFGDLVPYWDDTWSSGKLESIISDLVIQKKINVDQLNTFVENMYFIGHSPEFVSPNLSEKSLTTSPDINKKKDELWEKYGPAIEAGDAVAMASFEQELIQFDKDYLGDDESMRYLLKGKFFNVVRKKLFLTHGMVESFGAKGQYDFIKNSLEQGWTEKSFPVIANEIRAGSYSRARETAKGGEDSKFILRVFQNTRIIEEDCKTKRFFAISVRKDNAKDYLYRNYIADDGSIKTVDENTALAGKVIKFRSPLYCETQGGYCYTCMGKLFENTRQAVLASSIQNLSSSFLTASLKSMHGLSVKTVDVSDLNSFLLK